MKLLIAVIQDYDCGALLSALSDEGLGATRVASAGGFLRAGNTTVLIGVEDDRLATAVDLLRRICHRRTTTPVASIDLGGLEAYDVAESRIGGGVAFVATVERFERIPPASRPMSTDAD